MKVLLIEVDRLMAEFIATSVRSDHNEVTIINNDEEGYSAAQLGGFGLIIIDNDSLKADAANICGDLRKLRINTPILVLSGSPIEDDCVRVLDAGADDFLRKPFGFKELNARVRAVCRRPSFVMQSDLTYADITIEANTRTVRKAGALIGLRPKEYELLEYFMRNPEVALSKKKILKDVWNIAEGKSSNRLEVHVNHLRAKIHNNNGESEQLIKTVRNIGYILKS